MKVGIITFHRAENFGAVLQAYALQSCLTELGGDVHVIDYRPASIESMYHIFNPSILASRKNIFKSLELYLKRFLNIGDRKERKKKYSSFRDEFLQLSNISDLDSFDVLITGSDQVWNLHLTGGFDNLFFLYSAACNGKTKLAYAASSDKDPDHLMSRHSDKIRKALESFTAISVREEALKEEVAQFTDKEISVCVDPTLLLLEENYKNIAVKPAEEHYILVYQMTQTEKAIEAAKKLSSEGGGMIIEIYGGYISRKAPNIKTGLGPREILGYIMNADAVVTTSFHGLALSVISRKDVWVIDKGDNLRQRNLLEKLDLNDRMITEGSEASRYKHIDYGHVTERVNHLKSESILFLKKNIRIEE